ncbi:50S ribosomal protein L24 [Elusimicrobiota bacterium]
MKFKIRKKDTVMVVTGKDKGKKGEVLKVFEGTARALVAKINVATKHVKPTQSEPGGRRDKEMPISVSNLMLVCPKCEQAIRPKLDKLATGERIRVCGKCSEVIL